MQLASIVSLLALAGAPALAIPPPIFGFPDSDNHTELGVTYTYNGNATLVQEAMLFGYNSKSKVVVVLGSRRSAAQHSAAQWNSR